MKKSGEADRGVAGGFERTDSGSVAVTRVLGTGFDSLVATSRSTERVEHVATRVVDLWRDHQTTALEVQADQLVCGGKPVVDSRTTHWILPAFMAGVRAIRLAETARADDLLRFAEELSHLRTDVESLSSFRDWVWSEGAEGIDVELQLTFVEILEDAEAGNAAAEGEYGLAGAQALLPLDHDAVAIDLADLDAATLRPEFMTAVSLFRDGHTYRGFEMTPGESKTIADAAEDETRWSDAELRYVLDSPRAQSGFPPVRLARRLVQRFERSCDAGALRLIATLSEDSREYAKATLVELQRLELGRRLAQGLTPAVLRDARSSLAEILRALGTDQLRAFMWQVTRQLGAGEPLGEQSFAFLLETLGLEKVRATIDEPNLSAELATGYLRGIRAHAPLKTWVAVISSLPFDNTVPVLAAASAEELVAADEPLRRGLHASGLGREQLVQPLLDSSSGTLLSSLFTVALDCDVSSWSTAQVSLVFERAVCASDQWAHQLVERSRQNDFDERLRLIALDCLSRRPGSLEEVSRFSVREWFAPTTVRERIRELRRQARTNPRTDALRST